MAGEPVEALDALRLACRRFPDEESLSAALADALARSGERDAALAEARRWPGSDWAAALALKLLLREGRLAEAEAFKEKVAVADPGNPHLFELRATRLRQRPEAMLRLCDAVLAHEAGAAHAVYHKAIALAQLGRAAEAAELMGTERFLSIAGLAPPGGDPDSFHAELRAEILANPTLRPDPAGHATRHGLRSGSFPMPGDASGTTLVGAIRQAIESYCGTLSGHHPFVAAMPEQATLTTWAVILAGPGHQELHVHPARWLTGVYYVSAPEGPSRLGAIRIGGLPAWARVEPPWPIREVEPEPGTLLLFPSHVPHETLPTGSRTERISVAFDVAPAAAAIRR
jgi:hypothetical protein